MGFEGQLPEGIEGVSPAFIEGLYARYSADPNSVDASWRQFFEGLEKASTAPSWARPNWPLSTTDSLTAAMDPTQMTVEPKADAKAAKAAVAAAPTGVRSEEHTSELQSIMRTSYA